METIRVLLAHHHELVRAGIRLLLEEMPGIDVIREASDGRELIRLVEQYDPTIVLADIGLPGLIDLEVTRNLAKSSQAARVVMLSTHADKESFYVALRAGAVGYLLKDATSEEFELAIRTVAQGETYLRPPLSKPETPLQGLSIRQTQVLRRIAQSKTTKQIALELNISVKTVEAHRTRLMDALGINDIPALVRFAIKAGVVSSEE